MTAQQPQQPKNMTNITSNIRKREIGASRVGLRGREIFEEINSYLPLLQKIGATEQLIDRTSRAVMQLNEGEIFMCLSDILSQRAIHSTINDEPLKEDEKNKLNQLRDFLRTFIKDQDYIWSIQNTIELVNNLERDIWAETLDLEDLEDRYYAEQFERYLDLEDDGYSTD